MHLDKTKVVFSEFSLVDDFGRVFFYEGKVFRAIYFQSEKLCVDLIHSDLFRELVKKKLVPKTFITNYSLEGFSIILEHEYVYPSKPHHWSFSMYKDAALLVLRINRLCNDHGYELKDAHPFNVFFKDNDPIFVDIGSIARIHKNHYWRAYEQFLNSFYIQLLVWARPDFFLARKLIEDGNHPVQRTIPMSNILESSFLPFFEDDLFDFGITLRGRQVYFGKSSAFAYKAIFILRKVLQVIVGGRTNLISLTKDFKTVDRVEKRIFSLERPKEQSLWGNYHSNYKLHDVIKSTPRFERIISLVKAHAADAKTAIDLAGNQGVFCQLLSQTMAFDRVVLTDYDANAIDIAYLGFKKDNVRVNAYLFNFMSPLRKDEVIYFRSDIVFALAITHHLILTQGYSLHSILNTICGFTKQFIVIEFMPLGLWGGKEDESITTPAWYNIEWFRSELSQFFEIIVEEQLEVNRVVFLGRNVRD